MSEPKGQLRILLYQENACTISIDADDDSTDLSDHKGG